MRDRSRVLLGVVLGAVVGYCSSAQAQLRVAGSPVQLLGNNPAVIMPIAQGVDLVINEVLYDPAGTDIGNEKIEIKNVGSVAVSLDSVALRVSHGTDDTFWAFPSGVVLSPGGILVVRWLSVGVNDEVNLFTGVPTDDGSPENASDGFWGNNSAAAADMVLAGSVNRTPFSLGLYRSVSPGSFVFDDPNRMIDFMQTGGSNAAPEAVAVAAGLWTAGDFAAFIDEGHSYEWLGTNSGGGETTLSSDFFDTCEPTIGSQNLFRPGPIADAGGPYAGVAGEPIQFDGSGSSHPGGEQLTFQWNFGDGSEGVGAQVTHTYARPGSYTVVLTVTDEKGCADRDTTVADVAFPVRTVAINEVLYDPRGGDIGNERIEIKNTGTTSIPLADWTLGIARGSRNTYWAFPQDATLAPGALLVVHWLATGTNDAANVFTGMPSDDGAPDNASDGFWGDNSAITDTLVLGGIANQTPIGVSLFRETPPGLLDFSNPDRLSDFMQIGGRTGQEALAVEAGLWLAGDFTSLIAEGHSYEWKGTDSGDAGGFTIKQEGLTLSSDFFDACPPSIGTENTFLSAPVADAGGPYIGTVGQPIVFSATGSSDADGDSLTFAWDFGDGTTGSGITASHAYADTGTFAVVLTVTDSRGCASSDTTRATVMPAGVILRNLAFNEVLYDPAGPDLGSEKIEIRNVGSTAQSLDNFAIGLNQGGHASYWAFPRNKVLQPGAILVVHWLADGADDPGNVFTGLPSDDGTPANASDGFWGDNSSAAASMVFAGTANDTAFGLSLFQNLPPGSLNVSTPDNLVDFVQIGGAGTGQEAVAAEAGLWRAGEFAPFIDEAHSYEWTGNNSGGNLLTLAADFFDACPPSIGMDNTFLSAPVADAGGPYSGFVFDPIAFDGSASADPDGGALTFAWDFGDGTTGEGATPAHAYADTGSFTVVLTVTDPDGCMDRDTTRVAVGLAPRNVVLNEVFYDPPGDDLGSERIELKNTGATSATLDGYAVRISQGGRDTFWAFPPGLSIPAKSLLVVNWLDTGSDGGVTVFTGVPSDDGTPGNASDGFWGNNSAAAQDMVLGGPGNDTPFGIGLYRHVSAGTFAFDNPLRLVDFVQIGADGDSVAVEAGLWRTGEALAFVGEGASYEWKGTNSGGGDLTLAEDWFAACSPSINQENIFNRAPIADAGGPYSGSVGQEILFDGSGSSDPNGDSLSFQWDFGDGTSGSGVKVGHIYRESGTFTAVLTVDDGHGCTDSDSVEVTVQAPVVLKVEIVSPEDGSIACDDSVLVQVKVSPPDSVVSCEINSFPADPGDSLISAMIPLSMGTNLIVATCVARDGTVVADTIRVRRVKDDTPPTSEVSVSDDGSEITVIFRDDTGIASIEKEVLKNGELIIDDFQVGDREVSVLIRRIDPDQPVRWSLVATDLCGNKLKVDPVWLQLAASSGSGEHTFQILDVDRYLYIVNSGLSELEIDLNERRLLVKSHPRFRGKDGTTFYIPVEGDALIDLQPFLKEGDNDVRIRFRGPQGSSGVVVFSDVDFGLGRLAADGIDIETLPLTMTLYPNYPNPFNPQTTITFDVPRKYMEAVPTRLAIYNLRGQLVRLLVDRALYAGHYEYVWDATDTAGSPVASGVYIYQLIVGRHHTARRMTLLK